MSENIINEPASDVLTNETSPSQPQLKRHFCKYCGGEINANSAFCAHCGKPLASVPQQQNSSSVPQQTQQTGGQQISYAAAVPQQPAQAAVSNSTQNTSTTVIVQGGRSNGMGTAGFVFALLAFFVCWVPIVDFIVWFLGALFSFIGLFKAPRGLAIAGFILSFIGIIILLTFFGALIGLAAR